MTSDEAAELLILNLGNENGKFAISITAKLTRRQQFALERLQLREWIRLIDVCLLALAPGEAGAGASPPAVPQDSAWQPGAEPSEECLMRVFLLSESARIWLREHGG